MSKTILVTGISGFIGMQCARDLLDHGYQVRGTLRSAKKANPVRDALVGAVPGSSSQLSFIEANLTDDKGWDEAVQGCDGILHVASPFPAGEPKNENDLIIPAREGTLRVLRAAAKAGVPRLVLTSSMVAVFHGNRDRSTPLTGKDWSQLDKGPIGAYAKSKTLAEKAAWDFVASPEGKNIALSTVNPGLVLGPAVSKDFGTSLDLIKQMMTGALPASPPIHLPVVDVRDVATAHRRSLEVQQAIGQRFLLVEEVLWFKQIAEILKANFPRHKAPVKELPAWLVRFMANFRADLKSVVADLGQEMIVDNRPAQEVLGVRFHHAEDMIVAAAESLIAAGAVKKK